MAKSGDRNLATDTVDCLVVEDAPAGVEAGLRAGMRAIAVTTTHHATDLKTPWIVGDLASIHLDEGRSDQWSARMRLLVKG